MLVLNLGGIVAPLLDGGEFLVSRFAAQIVRGIRDHADVDAILVVSVEKILDHHGAAALAPFRAALAVERAKIARRLFRSINVRVPVDDHASAPLSMR